MLTQEQPAYCFYSEFPATPSAQFCFDRHYLMYAISGSIEIEVEGARWVLPPTFGAWIPARTAFLAKMAQPTTCCSLLFEVGFEAPIPTEFKVFLMSPLARDMIFHARRWGPDHQDGAFHATAFFQSIVATCAELAAAPTDLWRPSAHTEMVQKALEQTEERLCDDVSFSEIAEAAHMSERTLARRFNDEVGMTWGQALRRLRMIRAVEILSHEETGILDVCYRVGYGSLSAFNKAFKAFTGLTPTEFRARHQGGWSIPELGR